MGLNVYYPQDIRNALLAAEQASSAALAATGDDGDLYARGYRDGYRAGLVTIALAFGLGPQLGPETSPSPVCARKLKGGTK